MLRTKVDNVRFKELTPETLDAAAREARGEVVALKADGTPYDHQTKANNGRMSLQKQIRIIRGQLEVEGLSDADIADLQGILKDATEALQKYDDVMPRPEGP